MRPHRLVVLVSALLLNASLLAGLVSAGARPDADAGVDRATRIALEHVRENAAELRLTSADLAGLNVTDAYRSGHNGVTHVYLGQGHLGLEVVGPSMTVNIARDGTVLHATSRLMRNVSGRATGHIVLKPDAALERATSALHLKLTQEIEVISGPIGTERRVLLTGGGISAAPIPVRLVYQPASSGRLRLAWAMRIEDVSGGHRWVVSIDAESGAVLRADDLVLRDNVQTTAKALTHEGGAFAAREIGPEPTGDGAKYRVYALPLESPNDGPRTLEESPADALGSPYGWHDTDGAAGPEFTVTRGNNAHAYADPNPFVIAEPLPLMDAECGPSLNCDHPLDFQLPPHAWRQASITNLFYWNNVVHDVFYRYGFDEAAGNFQVNNYGRGGIGGDHVFAEGQDHGFVNNAGFWPAPEGEPGVMEMFFWVNPPSTRVIDGSLDSGVITHEYGHGISTRLTGGPARIDCLQGGEQGGEGWSDWVALALTARPGDSGPQRRGMGTYVLNEPDRSSDGIRPTPYSTSMTINPATYDSIKDLVAPHGVGYVWATILWEVYWALVGEHGFNPDVYRDWTTGGNNLAIQLVVDGMKFQPCNPGFVDARNAILAANAALTDGVEESVNHCVIWGAFAKRGLGASAKQGSASNKNDGTQAFDLPPGCAS